MMEKIKQKSIDLVNKKLSKVFYTQLKEIRDRFMQGIFDEKDDELIHAMKKHFISAKKNVYKLYRNDIKIRTEQEDALGGIIDKLERVTVAWVLKDAQKSDEPFKELLYIFKSFSVDEMKRQSLQLRWEAGDKDF